MQRSIYYTSRQTLRNLFLLVTIFVVGLVSQAALNFSLSSYISELDHQVRNAEVEQLLGQEIILEIHKIESDFYEMATFPNKHLRKIIQQRLLESDNELTEVLEILNIGGTFKHRIDLNLPNTDTQYEILFYEPFKEDNFSFARADILPKVELIISQLNALSQKLDEIDHYREQDSNQLNRAIGELKLSVKLFKPIFHRLKEDANRIFYRNKLNFQEIRNKVDEQKNFYHSVQISLTISVVLLGLTAFWSLSKNIQRATKEIENSNNYTQEILDSQSNIIIVNDGSKIIDVSGGFFEFFHDIPTLEDFANRYNCICDLFIREEGYIWNFDDSSWTDYIINHPYETHKAKLIYDGKVYIFKLDASKSVRNKRYIISMFDITSLEDIRHDIEEQKDQALAATKSKGQFLANMSHEIRTPLNAILGFIALLKEKKLDEESHSYLETIDGSGHSLLGIINDILDLSKIENGKLTLDMNDFDPRKELMNVANLFKARSLEKDINFSIDIANTVPNGIRTDSLRLKQVIANLLSNAVKFTHAGKQIIMRVEYDPGWLRISVKDEGIGMSRDAQQKVFEAFSQAESSTTRKYGGTGLGLTISSKLVEMLSGELKVTSKLNEGSCFYFSIPVKEVQLKAEKITSMNDLKFNGSLLLVEDNPTNQILMSAIFKKLGLEFDIASDGFEAIKALSERHYDLVFMDENMPNLNGIEATKRIRQQEEAKATGQHQIIIALTANAMSGDRERFLAAGMDEYLSKPINISQLQKVLKQFLNKSR